MASFRKPGLGTDLWRRLVRYYPAGTHGLSWHQLRASHQIRLESFRMPGLGTEFMEEIGQVISSWQHGAELATGDGFSSDHPRVVQKAWDFLLRK